MIVEYLIVMQQLSLEYHSDRKVPWQIIYLLSIHHLIDWLHVYAL